ncbi:MAG: histidine phosphatase family protein [Desulfurococcales archaeon]|nr:histidine phosphatase family protein [Desulfurococcales archaeon]
MIIGFMRHGKAEPKGEKPDEDRSLTSEGRRSVESIAGILPFKPSIVYSSPYKRALQTAEIIASIHGVGIRVSDKLKPGVFSMDSLREINPGDKALLVGHAPSIEMVVSSLVGGGNIKMKPSSVAIVEAESLDYSAAILVALLLPPGMSL